MAAIGLAVFILFRFILVRRASFPPSLALLAFGLGAGVVFGPILSPVTLSAAFPVLELPGRTDLWLAITLLVIPQLPLTLGNAVISTSDTSRTFFGDRAQRVTPKTLAASMGLANVVVGLFGAMPMCHGAGGLTAHYKLGARTGGAGLMIGGLLLFLGVIFGPSALPLISLIPLPVLGVLLAIVGVYHASLVRGLAGKSQYSTALVVAVVTIISGNLALGSGAGILQHYLSRFFIRTFAYATIEVDKP